MDANRRAALSATILCIPSRVGFSHLARLLLIARRLVARGHAVSFAYSGRHRDALEADGFAALPLHDVDVDPYEDAYAAWSADDVARAVDDVETAIAATRADAVLADFHPAATIAARRVGVPSAAVVPFELAPGFDASALLFGSRPRRVAGWIARTAFESRSRELAGPFRSAVPGRRRATVADVFRGDATLVAELAEFAPRLRPAAGQRVIGPLVWEEDGEPLEPPPAGVARVYATIGNTGRRELLDVAVEALHDLPGVELVITSGRYVTPPSGAPSMRPYRVLPGSPLMRTSQLAIHCGGRGTTYQALASGTPAIVVPYVTGQAATARLVERHGVGIGIDPERLDAARLRAAVQHALLWDPFRQRCARFARLLEQTDGAAAAADAVEALVGDASPAPL